MISSNIDQVEVFCQRMYIKALQKANEKQINWAQYKKDLQGQLRKSKIPFQKVKLYILYSKKDWIQDLLQVTRDLKLVLETQNQYRKKLNDRLNMHFGSGHSVNLSKLPVKSIATKKVISMYKQSHQKQWTPAKFPHLTDFLLQNTAYILGLTKGNGVVVEQKYLMTCAHVIADDRFKIARYRGFATGNGSYGIIKVDPNGIFLDNDVGFGKLIKIFQGQKKSYPFFLTIPIFFQLNKTFKPTRCIQVGVLFNDQDQSSQIKAFQASEGFIERNLYRGPQDYSLIDGMGLLVHNCYGLWGTSGSPLWTAQGQLLGIHNAWNENGYNISMIVHDDDTQKCRVVKQYERRAIGARVLVALFEQWREFQDELEMKSDGIPEAQIQISEKIRKKVKL